MVRVVGVVLLYSMVLHRCYGMGNNAPMMNGAAPIYSLPVSSRHVSRYCGRYIFIEVVISRYASSDLLPVTPPFDNHETVISLEDEQVVPDSIGTMQVAMAILENDQVVPDIDMLDQVVPDIDNS